MRRSISQNLVSETLHAVGVPVGRQILRYECSSDECSLDFFAVAAQADANRKSGSAAPNCSVGGRERNLTVRRFRPRNQPTGSSDNLESSAYKASVQMNRSKNGEIS